MQDHWEVPMPTYAPQQTSQVAAQPFWQAPDAAQGVWQAQQQPVNGSQDVWPNQQQQPVQQQPVQQQPMQPAPAAYAIAASSASVAQQVPGQIIMMLHGPVQAGFNDLCFCWDPECMIPAYFLDVPFLSGTCSLMRGGTKEDPLILTIHSTWGQKLLQGPAQEYITCAENKNFLFQTRAFMKKEYVLSGQAFRWKAKHANGGRWSLYHAAYKTELAAFSGGTLEILSTCNDYQVHPDLIVGTFYAFYQEIQAAKRDLNRRKFQ